MSEPLSPDSIDELAKLIRERYTQVGTATHQRLCPWEDDGICSDSKCDRKPCDDSQNIIVLGLKKSS